jgi:hypothetical protein
MFIRTLHRDMGAEFEALHVLWLDPALPAPKRSLALRQRLQRWARQRAPFHFEVDLRGLLAL